MQNQCQFIAITGGPGAGKTTMLDLIKKVVCKHIVILPEAAGIIYGGGFWRMDSISSKVCAQKAIFHVQSEMENLVKGEDKWTTVLCDRGTLDGLAYWPSFESEYFKSFNTTIENEYARYKAVIHLRSPDFENGYNYKNPLRVETPAEAARIDQRIHEIWKNHPNYHVIESSKSFLDKINLAIAKVEELMPKCCDRQMFYQVPVLNIKD